MNIYIILVNGRPHSAVMSERSAQKVVRWLSNEGWYQEKELSFTKMVVSSEEEIDNYLTQH